MIKEANDNSKPKTPKTPKQQKTCTTQCEDMSKTATHKRNATERSPLEGNPGKKQKESTNIPQNQETNGKQELHDEDPNTDQCIDKYPRRNSTKKIKNDPDHGHEQDTNPILQDLLEELRDIKNQY